jgi:hypothetical protein
VTGALNSRSSYIARINRVLDHIDAHLAEPLCLDSLASVANFSPWHKLSENGCGGRTVSNPVRAEPVEASLRFATALRQAQCERVCDQNASCTRAENIVPFVP